MPSRTLLAVLAIPLCASVALGTLDVATDIVSPDTFEVPGLIPVQVRLTNIGDTAALVPRIDVTVSDGYSDHRQDISVAVGESTVVTFISWVCPLGCHETCTAWMTYPADSNHSNDTDVVVVRSASRMDVVTEIVSPVDSEEPGLVPVQIRLTNRFVEPALVPRLDVKVSSGYADSSLNISVAPGVDTVVTLNPWVYPGGTETCTAYITYPADSNHSNDTDVVIVNAGGVSDRVETELCAGMSLTLTPSPLAGDVLHVRYGLNRAGPASLTFFDVRGRAAIRRDFAGNRREELPLSLSGLSGGVYIVRLADGRSAVSRKLVLPR